MTNDGPHRLPVLLVPGFVEAVFFANDFLNGRRQRFLTRIEVPGGEFDQDPRNRDHDEDRRDRHEQSSDNEPKHSLITVRVHRTTPRSNSACRNPTSPDRARCKHTSTRTKRLDSDTCLSRKVSSANSLMVCQSG